MDSKHIGHVEELVRYPVKSMAGQKMESTTLGWHGLPGDRRFAFRRIDNASGFPWLTASRLPALIGYEPTDFDESSDEALPGSVRTPSGVEMDIRGDELSREVGALFGSEVEMMQLQQGIFDDAVISAISTATVSHICSQAGVPIDGRRFRPNIVLKCHDANPFQENDWLDVLLSFGESEQAPAIHVTKLDERCMMINLDPDKARQNAEVLKTTVRLNNNFAGVYATVVRTGVIRVGDPVMIV